MNKVPMIGKRFGKLTVTGESSQRKHKEIVWVCRCDCGSTCYVTGFNLRSGNTKSCGCLHHEFMVNHNPIKSRQRDPNEPKHGDSYTRLYRIFYAMKKRCYNPKASNYRNYGGRGITVCPGWNCSFAAFRDWAMANGYADDLSIDRIDVNGNYEPSNCRWATMKEQQNNRRNSKKVTL